MARGKDFKMRLLEEEAADLNARAARDGLAKADVIRKAMGWSTVELIKPGSSPGPAKVSPPPAPTSDEPGVSAADELARRIQERRKG